MIMKEPLKQYLWRWFKEKIKKDVSSPDIGGIIIKVIDTSQNRLLFIRTTSESHVLNRWMTHDPNGKPRDTWLTEYRPSENEKRIAIKSVFIFEKDIKSA